MYFIIEEMENGITVLRTRSIFSSQISGQCKSGFGLVTKNTIWPLCIHGLTTDYSLYMRLSGNGSLSTHLITEVRPGKYIAKNLSSTHAITDELKKMYEISN
ncbi:hypothetical protein GDO78_008801 [Eleutherodactylus coqui]|uniref:Uncharacterized protein n=1 Tax=Eleutherodactylus coqui TaxID=57060 RepID=A0A8J6FE92_ELECQ|nr:hypothetical protein GDO78_008801 [Eleutherodactylus coqui]